MKAVLGTLVVGTVLALSSVPSSASPIYSEYPAGGNLGTYPSSMPTLNYGFTATPGEFSDTFTFAITSPLQIALGYSSVYVKPSMKVQSLSLDLYSVDAFGQKTFIDGNTGVDDPAQSKVSNTLTEMLGAGSYSFTINGVTAANTVSGIAGTVSYTVSAVPLPASAPMFGAAILALGAVGYGVKRKKAAAAA